MAVVVPRTGGFGSDAMNAAAAIIQGLNAARGDAQETEWLKAKLLEGTGTFEPSQVPASSSFLDRIFGPIGGPNTVRIGNASFTHTPYPRLTEQDLLSMGLTMPSGPGEAPQTINPLVGQRIDQKTRFALLQDAIKSRREERANQQFTEAMRQLGSVPVVPSPPSPPQATSGEPQPISTAGQPGRSGGEQFIPSAPVVAPRATQSALAQQGPLIQGIPGPPTPGMTRFNTTLDGQALSVDRPTIEEAQAFIERRFPGRTFQLTAEATPLPQALGQTVDAASVQPNAEIAQRETRIQAIRQILLSQPKLAPNRIAALTEQIRQFEREIVELKKPGQKMAGIPAKVAEDTAVAMQVPTDKTDLPNRLARDLFKLPSFAAADDRQAAVINNTIQALNVEDKSAVATQVPAGLTSEEDLLARAMFDLPNSAAASQPQAESIRLRKQALKEADEKQKKDVAIELDRNAKSNERIPPNVQLHFVDPETLRPFRQSMTWAQIVAQPQLIVSEGELKEIEALDTMRPMIQEIKGLVGEVFGPGGPLERVSRQQGLGGRLTGRAAKVVQDLKQSNPLVRVLDERLREYGTRSIVALEGLKGRPAFALLQPALDVRPSLGDPGIFGLGGRLPDTKESILGQMNSTEQLLNQIQQGIVRGYTRPKEAPTVPPTDRSSLLPPASGFPVNYEVLDEATGIQYRNTGGRWTPFTTEQPTPQRTAPNTAPTQVSPPPGIDALGQSGRLPTSSSPSTPPPTPDGWGSVTVSP